MGLGRPVIFTCSEKDIDKAHFDTRQYNHITWTDPADLREKLKNRIEATIFWHTSRRGTNSLLHPKGEGGIRVLLPRRGQRE